jgi:1-acyl-sn-glycerol-3-phosphate acyltransferase
MRTLRVATRLILFAFVTGTYYIAWVPVRVFSRSSARRRSWRKRIITGWARSLLRILDVELKTKGIVPSPPFFAVANHLSYLDIVCFSALVDCVFVARSDVEWWPVFGPLAKAADTIFINRSQHHDIPRAIEEIEKRLNEGYGIVLFPEGTSSKGEGVLPFRASLLEPAASLDLPVHPAVISYATPSDEKPAFLSICWWGEMPFVGHFLEMLSLEKSEASIEFLTPALSDSNRKVLARKLWVQVANNFTPLVDPARESDVFLRHPKYRPSWY